MPSLLFHGKEGRTILEQLREVIGSAEKRILVSSAWISSDVIGELFSDVPSNVEKRVIIRASEKRDLDIDKPESIETFRKLGFEIAFHPNVHAKFIVIDDRVAVIGSSNLTRNGLLGGNVELNITFEGDIVRELSERFETIWKESVKVLEEILGITMNPGKPLSAEFLVLDEENVREQMFVVIETEDGRNYLARVNSLMIYDTSFFMNPFTTEEGKKFPSFEEFSFINYSKSKDWRVGAITALLNSKSSPSFTIATASVEGRIVEEGGKYALERDFKPIPPRSWVKKLSSHYEDLFKKLMKDDSKPLRIGKIFGSDQGAFVSFEEISKTHMAVLGTTGSGKSYFTKCLLKRMLIDLSEEPLRIFVFDPHGEYASEMSDWAEKAGVSEHIRVVKLSGDIPVPLDVEDWKNILSKFGLFSGDMGIFNSLMIEKIFQREEARGLKDVSLIEPPDGRNKNQIPVLKERISSGEKPLLVKKLPLVLVEEMYKELIERVIDQIERIDRELEDSSGRMVIYSFQSISSPDVRISIAGYIGRYLFERAKAEGQGRKERYVLVLEEAHNFVPERSFGDVTAGKSNPSYRIFTKIASEGRKFNVALISITQRPANVSKYILAQSNTMVVFRTVNDSDLSAIRDMAESASKNIISLLPSLGRGQAFVFGLGVPLSSLVEVSCDMS